MTRRAGANAFGGGMATMTDGTQAERTHAEIARSAATIKASAAEQVDSADRRTELAADRTVLAAERTYAAWVRTGLAALASGVGARKLLEGTVPDRLALLAAGTLVLFGAFCFIAAVWRDVSPRIEHPRPETRRLPTPVLLVANGVLVLVALAAFVGVVSGR